MESASPDLIGRHLPRPIHKKLIEYLNREFVRTSWEWECKFRATDNPDFLEIRSIMKGSLRNCGSKESDFPFFAAVDPSPYRTSEITRVRLVGRDGQDGFDETPTKDKLKTLSDGSICFEKEISLKSGEAYETHIETIEYRPSNSFFIPLFIGTPSEGATVRAYFDTTAFDINLQIPAIEDTDLKQELLSFGDGVSWKIDHALLPGQCLFLYWKAKALATSAKTMETPEADSVAPVPIPLEVESAKFNMGERNADN